MDQANSSPTPMVSTSKLSQSSGCAIENAGDYRSIVGALQYVVITRPDITFAVNKVCQFMHRPLDQHFQAVKRILWYLQGTIDYGLKFKKTHTLDVVGYSDANWGSDVDDRRSTTCFCVFLGGYPVAWGSKKQSTVSRSTAEVEYRGLAHTVTEVVWLESLLSELHVVRLQKPTIWCDSSGAVAVAANPVLHSKFKHVELDLFFVREKVSDGKLVVGHIPAHKQVTDIFTKPFSVSLFTKFRSYLKIVQKHSA
ncbi:secreted RxLR effector protein 161-like [Gossypium hirsutum]|uniref:Secreted RxLR effector protein 161-like n=1 Tax=Gossypium hirsutum TaxID=3635 RepID=A0A1U8K1A1_GOSHI|nr:secreted RxLR effector protein 161-like [Gossypium hirsutum]